MKRNECVVEHDICMHFEYAERLLDYVIYVLSQPHSPEGNNGYTEQ